MSKESPFDQLSKHDRQNSEQATQLLQNLKVEYVLFDSKARTVVLHFDNGKEFKVINLDSILDVSIETKIKK